MKTTVTVLVSVDPQTAFTAFTDEMDLWYVRGPINYFDFARAVGMRCESGVGGRVIEIYDEATGDGLELARITAWEPGRRLAWTSSIDDVVTEIWFRRHGDGTEITVEAAIPDGGRSEGGTAWVRTVPGWFPSWCDRRLTARRPPDELGRLAVVLLYADQVGAAHWLAEVFDLHSTGALPSTSDSGPQWIEFRVGNCSVIIRPDGRAPDPGAPPPQRTWVYVDDLEAHLARARSGGARIVEDIHQHGYRSYTAEDPGGHHWTFVQAGPRQ